LYNIDIRKPFIHTDLPEPVCHATSKCGILAKSHTITSQLTSFHNAIGISTFLELNSLDAITSFNHTACLLLLGTSIQTTPSPGIGACILIDFACKAKVKSFCRLIIFFNATHALGFNLN
jgi:hypothetical protein